jgi:beta-glucosidase-like glycosyl hydrolase
MSRWRVPVKTISKPNHMLPRRVNLRAIIGLFVVSLAIITCLPQGAVGQGQGIFHREKPDRVVVRAQLNLGIRLTDQAYQLIQGTEDPEELERANALAFESYKLLRFALAGVVGLKGTSKAAKFFVDPSLRLAEDFIDKAMFHTRVARGKLGTSIRWKEGRRTGIASALTDLAETLRYARRAVEIL